jgi:DNA-binding GntR family transcriptional regulator
LSGEGLIILVPNVGARVAQLEPIELSEVYLIREQLEPAALSQSIPHLTMGQLTALDEMHAAMDEVADAKGPRAFGKFLEIDRDFHLLLTSAAPTKRLNSLVRETINTVQPYRRAGVAGERRRPLRMVNDEHRMILDAVRHGEAPEAAMLLKLHVRRARQAFETPGDSLDADDH